MQSCGRAADRGRARRSRSRRVPRCVFENVTVHATASRRSASRFGSTSQRADEPRGAAVRRNATQLFEQRKASLRPLELGAAETCRIDSGPPAERVDLKTAVVGEDGGGNCRSRSAVCERLRLQQARCPRSCRRPRARPHTCGSVLDLQRRFREDRFELAQLSRIARRDVVFHDPRRKTAMNASCGNSTLPTRFMRSLPTFCFSSSLRLRVMSPP